MARRPAAVSKAEPPQPWDPAPYDLTDLHAIKAVEAGTATAEQQTRAWGWICLTLCRHNLPTFHPESIRASDFAEGKRFVGLQLMRIAKTPADRLKAEMKQQGATNG